MEGNSQKRKGIVTSLPIETYAIGMLRGSSPFNLKPIANGGKPIISRDLFLERNVNFVADPFAYFKDGTCYLFYEVMETGTRKGKIYMSSSADLRNWTNGKLILEESFHLSYPQIFAHQGSLYMVPESFESETVRLYRCTDFPYTWSFEKTLLSKSCVDSTLFFDKDRWWMFVCDTPYSHDRLRLFYTDALDGHWQEHPKSPLHTNDAYHSRPAGKLLSYKNRLYRFAQNCTPFYGHSVNAFEIEKIDKENYSEKPLLDNPLLRAGTDDWNKVSMHHIDLHQMDEGDWIAFVDGRKN